MGHYCNHVLASSLSGRSDQVLALYVMRTSLLPDWFEEEK